MDKRLWRAGLVLSVTVGLSAAARAQAQPAGGSAPQNPPPSSAPSADAKPADASAGPSQELQDRVVALVQKRQCNDAVAEARKGGDENLAEQVADMCGIKAGGGGASPAGGRGGGGGGRGRGGGGGPR